MPADYDPQDPLPEPGFFWRRLLTFFASGALLGLLWLLAFKLPAGDLLAFAQGLMLLIALAWVLYMGGASATDLARVLQSASIFKRFGVGGRAARDDEDDPTLYAGPRE
jgi:hypothetical protein